MAGRSEAGRKSPHLDSGEKEQAAQHAAPQALVIHEVVREEGEAELERRPAAVWWSGLAAGLSMGFSFLCLSLIRGSLPDAPWSHLVYSAGYTVGFLIVILGRQELFTESTLTAMLPLLVRRDRATLVAVIRFWVIVLLANFVGTGIFGGLLAIPGIFPNEVERALHTTANEALGGPFVSTVMKAVMAGWLIALMAWLLPSARSARLFVILLLTYVVGLAGLPHIIAGSVEGAFSVVVGDTPLREYVVNFLLPSLLGNTLGGIALVALLNHAPLAPELQQTPPQEKSPSGNRRRAP
jgi:formate-nitrite transporter family protein